MKKRYYLILVIILIIFLSIFLMSFGQNKQACLSLTFDDGLKSHYDIAYPLLKEKDFGATFFIVANKTSNFIKEGYILMSSEEIKELVDNGFEIGSHTLSHPFLTELDDEEIEKELLESKEFLEGEYNITVMSLAIPYGNLNSKILDIAKKYYLTARLIYNKNPSAFFLNSFGLKRETSSEDVCKYIKNAKENNLWLILVFHDITDFPRNWDTSVEDFEEILNCAENYEIEVDSIRECKEKIE